MEISKTHQVIIFNPLDLKEENFCKLLLVVFKEDPLETKKFLTNDPGYWYSDAYPLEVAQIFKHKLIKLSNDLKLSLVVKMEKSKNESK